MEMVNDDGTNRRYEHGNLKKIMKISDSDANLLAMIKSLGMKMVSRDDQVYKEFIDKFRIIWIG